MRISELEKNTLITGGKIRLRITKAADGNVAIDIDAKSGRTWKPVAGSDRNTVAVFPSTDSNGPILHTRNRSIGFSQKLEEITAKNGDAKLILSGKAGSHTVRQVITFSESDSAVNVRVTCTLGKPVRVAGLFSHWIFVPDQMLYSQYAPLDFCWIPHLRRSSDHLIADQIFRSPAVIFQTDKTAAAIVPDLDVLSQSRPITTALDARLESPSINAPSFGYGFVPYCADGHVFFKHAPLQTPVKGELEYAFDIVATAEAPASGAHRIVLAHLWNRYGSKLIRNEAPQVLTLDDYAHRAYAYAFEHGDIWRDIKTDTNTETGGTMSLTFAGPTKPHILNSGETRASLRGMKLFPRIHSAAVEKLLPHKEFTDILEQSVHNLPLAVPPQVLFQSWFNNMRSAFGIMQYGQKWNDEKLITKSGAMKELALGAPGENGFMCSVCYCPNDGPPIWIQGTKAFEPVREHHIPDNAWTGWWMLRWHDEIERDKRLLDRVKTFCDSFMNVQLDSGAIPAWVRIRKTGVYASSTLRESAETAAPGMLLARFGRLHNKKKALDAAVKAADFLIDNIFPSNKWWDFETFFSCSKKDFGMRDKGSDIECMNNLCIFWTSELMRELAAATGDEKYFEYGVRALDLMLLWQQVWDAPYISINTFGGFGVMNTDAEWNDARQSMFAETLFGWYELTGEREYAERAVAALRSSFTTMLIPEHKEVAPGNLGMYIKKDDGAVYENYAHQGYDHRPQGYIMFDWGGGGACTSAASITEKYGDIFADAARGQAFGIDLCTVTGFKTTKKTIDIKVKIPDHARRKIKLKTINLEPGSYSLRLNGVSYGRFEMKKLESGVELEVSQ